MSAKAIIPAELKFLETEAGRSCLGSEVTTCSTAHFKQSWQSWLLVLMPVMEPEVGKIKITETQNDDETTMLILGFRAGSSFAQWHLLYSSVLPNLCSSHSWLCCALWDLSAPPWWRMDGNFIVSSMPSPTARQPQPDALIYQHNPTNQSSTCTLSSASVNQSDAIANTGCSSVFS